MKLAIPLVAAALLIFLSNGMGAEVPVQSWIRHYPVPGFGAAANAVVVDGDGNVLIAGGAQDDFIVIKYSNTGVALWTNRYNGPVSGPDMAVAVAVDGSNNVVVTGKSLGASDNYSYATLKYSAAGLPLWTNRYNTTADSVEYVSALAIDGSNNVIVAGTSLAASDGRSAIVKYSSAGTPIWTNLNVLIEGGTLAVDSSNNIVISGPGARGFDTIKLSSAGMPIWTNKCGSITDLPSFRCSLRVDANNNVIMATETDERYTTIKYSGTGIPLWTNYYVGRIGGEDYPMALAVDGGNDVIVTGYSGNGQGNFDFATIKYLQNGTPVWTNRYKGPLAPSNFDGAIGVATDDSNNVVVLGQSIGQGTDYDFVTIKYSKNGIPFWTNRYNGSANAADYARAIALDHSGNVIVAGSSQSSDGATSVTSLKLVSVGVPTLFGLQQTNGIFKARVENVLPNGTLVIETSTNLTSWRPIFTNSIATNLVLFEHPSVSGSPRQFYRAYQFP